MLFKKQKYLSDTDITKKNGFILFKTLLKKYHALNRHILIISLICLSPDFLFNSLKRFIKCSVFVWPCRGSRSLLLIVLWVTACLLSRVFLSSSNLIFKPLSLDSRVFSLCNISQLILKSFYSQHILFSQQVTNGGTHNELFISQKNLTLLHKGQS